MSKIAYSVGASHYMDLALKNLAQFFKLMPETPESKKLQEEVIKSLNALNIREG